ncbi:MAG: PAS domain-containing sensor histidine kinase [Candidatus Zixiibacteriota bacterium]
MKTAIIGGGRGCRAIIKLALGQFLKELPLDIRYVMDTDPNARGMVFAREQGIKTTTDINEVMALEGLELIIELTGRDAVLEEIYKIIPPGVKLIDHTFARIFWDLVNAQEDRKRQLEEMTIMEQKIEMERHFLQSLFDNIPDLVIVLNKEKQVIKINANFSRFTGMSFGEALGKTCDKLLQNTELAAQCRSTLPLLDDVLKQGKPRSVVWRTDAPEETHWEVIQTPILDQYGEVEAILVTWHRITEKVKLLREIESAEQRFRSFIDSAHDWISIKDLESRYLIVNPVTARSFHKKPKDFIGKKPSDMFPENLAKLIQRHDDEVIKSDRHRSYEETINIDGRDHHFNTVRFPLKDYKGSTIGVCTIMRDITSEKELRDQLVQSTKLAALGKLAAGVAHEINNPLSGVLAFAEDMLDDFDPDDPRHKDLSVIIRETLRCRDIVRNLLDFARQDNPKFEEHDLNTIIDQSVSLVEKLPQFRNISIAINKKEKMPKIQCDLYQIQQVLLNLMLNAADAMKEHGTLTITTDYDRRHDRCLIAVEDNGPGIPENLIDKIFEPFFSTKGTNGLGLAVSWGIIERHRGIIEVDIAESGGAIFRILLPALAGEK